MSLLQNGPYIYATGCVSRPELAARTALAAEEFSDAPIRFSDDGSYEIVHEFSIEEMKKPLERPILKASGVARARNSSRSTVFAALLAHEFIKYIKDFPDFDRNRVALGLCNCSASASLSWEFESEGITLGWDRSNTMLMPSCLPSSIGTQLSAAIDTHAATITFLDDILGVGAAFRYMYTSFFHDRSDYAFIISAEEFSPVHERGIQKFIGTRPLCCLMDGAAGVLLTRKKLTDSAWQLALCDHVSASGTLSLPESWKHAKSISLMLDEEASLSTLLFPYALQHLIKTKDADKILLTFGIKARGTFALGFQRVGN